VPRSGWIAISTTGTHRSASLGASVVQCGLPPGLSDISRASTMITASLATSDGCPPRAPIEIQRSLPLAFEPKTSTITSATTATAKPIHATRRSAR
jgi:hypothetical protein